MCVATYTLALSLVVLPLAVALFSTLFWPLGTELIGIAEGNKFALVCAAIIAPTFWSPLVWLSFRLRDRSVQLRDAVLTDALTGTPNRCAFFEHVGVSANAKGPLRLFSVLMIDMGRFKALNDRRDRGAGDPAYAAKAEGRDRWEVAPEDGMRFRMIA